MRIKFNQSYNHETHTKNGAVAQDYYSAGLVVRVRSVAVNENYQTAIIEFQDGYIAYGVPLAVFEVMDGEYP